MSNEEMDRNRNYIIILFPSMPSFLNWGKISKDVLGRKMTGVFFSWKELRMLTF